MEKRSEYCNNDILTHVFIELNNSTNSDKSISKEEIEDVIKNGQSLFTKEKMKEGSFEDVDYKYMGKVKARHGIIQKMNSRLKPKNEKKQ